jgi:hypothetical protein
MTKNLHRASENPSCARLEEHHKGLPRRRVGRSSKSEGRSRSAKAGWSPERRTRQAALIRSWAPWRRSTGPKTDVGKARCSMNALEHGYRSRATIGEYRRIRRILRQVARNIAILRAHIRARDQAARPQIKFKPWYAKRIAAEISLSERSPATPNLNSPLRGGRSAGARSAEADRVGAVPPMHCLSRPSNAIAPP